VGSIVERKGIICRVDIVGREEGRGNRGRDRREGRVRVGVEGGIGKGRLGGGLGERLIGRASYKILRL
jgi:hypothetical protein